MDFGPTDTERRADDGWDGDEDTPPWLDPDAPDYHPRRFIALIYRTSRALLAQKGLLSVGQALNELDEASFASKNPIRTPDSPYFDSRLPVEPDDTNFHDVQTLHGYTALQIGLHPDDPCLEWLQDETVFPVKEALLEFELEFLDAAGPKLRSRGRQQAFRCLEGFLGPVSRLERRDYMALPFAWVREMSAASTDDDRMLVSLRLDSVIQRAQNGLDLRVELAAIREQASIQGLKYQDPERGNRDLLQLFRQPRKLQIP